MSRITASTDFDRVPKEDVPRYVSIFSEQVARIMNGGLDFATNFNAQVLSVSFVAANSDQVIQHSLGRVPTGYILLKSSVAMAVYDGSTEATASMIILKASAIGSAKLLIF